jgi:hypothetical protein
MTFIRCLILQASIFVIISIIKNSFFKNIYKLSGVHDSGYGFNKLSCETQIDPICHYLNIYIKRIMSSCFFKSNHAFTNHLGCP